MSQSSQGRGPFASGLLSFLLVASLAGPCSAASDQVEIERKTVAFHAARAKQRPDDAAALRFLASALVKLAAVGGDGTDYDRAWENLDKAEVLEPGSPDTLRARARLLLSRHRFQQARALAEHGLSLWKDESDLLGLAGDAAFEVGDLKSAAAYYDKLHAVAPNLNTWARLAQVAEAQDRLKDAAGHLQKAMESGMRKGAPPESIAWCHAVLGEVHLKLGDPKMARNLYVEGLQKSPDHPLVLEHLAELEAVEQKLEASEAAYRKLVALRPDPVNRLRLAEVVSKRGDAQGAQTLRIESRNMLQRFVASGNEGYLRPLAELDLEDGYYSRAAALAARDVALRPTEESQALLKRVLSTAAAAGKPVNALQ
jgi:tetratricopeptide (TPR) repeat protein